MPDGLRFSTFLCMVARPFRAKIQQINHLTPDIREMTLSLIDPPVMSFQAGQAIGVQVPDRISNANFLRYFSLVSPPDSSKDLILLLNSKDRGKGSSFLLENEIGAEVQIFGPYGSFMLQHEQDRELLFVGTGTGVAPLWSMMATLLEEGCTQTITLLWGLRSERDRYYLQELDAWASQYQNFSYVLTLSQPSSEWHGKRGRVTDILQELASVGRLAVYVCGNRAMVKEVTDLLQKKGDCEIYRERHS